jgi:hypothetical protein
MEKRCVFFEVRSHFLNVIPPDININIPP